MSPLHLLIPVTLLLATLSLLSTAQQLVQTPSKDNSPQCDCYLISGQSPGYFQYHRFWDFRSIPSSGDDDYTVAPPLISASQDKGAEDVTSTYFNTSDIYSTDWNIQTWTQTPTDASPIRFVNSAQNIFVSRNTSSPSNSTYLTLRASRPSTHFMSGSELDNLQTNMKHASVRARFRIIPQNLSLPLSPASSSSEHPPPSTQGIITPQHPVAPGACWGFFTYGSATSEDDIEVLTRDPTNRIRYSSQPDYDAATDTAVSGASTDYFIPPSIGSSSSSDLSSSPGSSSADQGQAVWTDWLTHRLDWLPHQTQWWIDGQFALAKTLNVPRLPGNLIMNLWGDGGQWSGEMGVGESVSVGVEWVEVVFNVSGPLGGEDMGGGRSRRSRGNRNGRTEDGDDGDDDNGGSCRVACNVDGVARPGFPEVAPTTATGGALSSGAAAAAVVRGGAQDWGPAVVVGLLAVFAVAALF